MTNGTGSNPSPPANQLREYVTAAIALAVVVGAVVLIANAFRYVESAQPEHFQRVKDLLLFVNPVLGLVIGYYFNKASTEPRAEQAEAHAQQAATRAEEASEARQQAEAAAGAVRQEVSLTQSALEDLTEAAQHALDQLPAGEAVIPEAFGPERRAGEAQPARDDSFADLRAALRRARQVVRRGSAG